MIRTHIIIITTPTVEAWSNFKKLCEARGLPYNYLKKFKFPIKWKEYTVEKLEVN